MSPEERQLLTGLFDRIKTASATPRDRDAEVLIEQATREQPYATYYLAQAVIVQEKGLEAAALRIKELEERVHQLESTQADQGRATQGGGFLSSIFGSSQQPQPAAPTPSGATNGPTNGPWGNSGQRQDYRGPREYDDGYRAPPPPQQSGPWAGQQAAPSAGGSFLRSALGTAAGVAGGMLLANSLSGIFSNHTNSLGWGSPFAGSNPFGNESGNRPEETVINNYYGDSAGRDESGSASDNSDGGSGDGGGWQQADYDGDDSSDYGDDDTMNA